MRDPPVNRRIALLAFLCLWTWRSSPAETVWLASLDLSVSEHDWGEAQANRSFQDMTLSIGGQEFERGVGVHAESVIFVDLGGRAERFVAWVGVDDEVGGNVGSIEFHVIGDRRCSTTHDRCSDRSRHDLGNSGSGHAGGFHG